jgi:CDGSH-type Zn-finger protein
MSFEPKVAQKSPYVQDEEAGAKRAWCSCGLSSKQPFCDGTHRKEDTGMEPVVVTVEKACTTAWCGCKQSKNPPYCDGSHNAL